MQSSSEKIQRMFDEFRTEEEDLFFSTEVLELPFFKVFVSFMLPLLGFSPKDVEISLSFRHHGLERTAT